jgi:hypothetical protein
LGSISNVLIRSRRVRYGKRKTSFAVQGMLRELASSIREFAPEARGPQPDWESAVRRQIKHCA